MKYYCLRRSKNWDDGNQTRFLSSSMVSATQSLQKETALLSILLKHITVFQSGCWMTSHMASRCCFQELAVVPTVELCRVAQSELVSEVGECWWTDGITGEMSAGCWSWTHWSLGSALVSWLCLSAEAIAWILQNYPPSPFFPDTIKMAASPFSLSELMYSSLHTLSLSFSHSLSLSHTHTSYMVPFGADTLTHHCSSHQTNGNPPACWNYWWISLLPAPPIHSSSLQSRGDCGDTRSFCVVTA